MGRARTSPSLNHWRFVGGSIVLPDRILDSGEVVVQAGRITEVNAKPRRSKRHDAFQVVDLHGKYLSPGFVDLHVHGGAGSDFMDGQTQAVERAIHAHARHGTTTLFPTSTTGQQLEIAAMMRSVAECRRRWSPTMGARMPGIHLYGPYFAKEKAGCHRSDGCRVPSPSEFEWYFESGLVKIATCAAELHGAFAFYKAARQRRCLVTCGHSNASWPEMQAAFDAGMRHVDHFWCAMSNVSSVRQRFGVPMRGSMLEFVLAEKEMSTEVIADGWHLAPELLAFAYRMKGCHRLCLVTDSSRAMDMPRGEYRFGPKKTGAKFSSDGQVGWARNGSLASSVQGMDHMVRIMFRDSGAPMHEVIRMASLTPAERSGIDRQVGSIEIGKRADLVILNLQLEVEQVFIGGTPFTK